MHNFHPDMPCIQEMFGNICPSHSTDYDRFIQYTHLMDIKVHLAPHTMKSDDHINMHKCTHSWQAVQMHAWMTAGGRNLHSARKARWPIPDWMFHLPSMVSKPAVACEAILLHITFLPANPFFVTDGSRLSHGRVGGVVAICDSDTLVYQVYPIHRPIYLDHSFAIEMYVAWITLRM